MSALDPAAGTRRMLDLVAGLPRQLAESADLPGMDRPGGLPEHCRRIILCGMGGSAIAGDLAAPQLTGSGIQLTVWRDYGLPPWATAGDLVLASSYSGNTEETLAAVRAGGELGLERRVVTTGGALGALAAAEGLPQVTLPPGLPPRASLGYGLGVLVRLFGAWGLVPDADDQISAAIWALERANPARTADDPDGTPPADPAGHVPVRELAAALAGRVPVIHTAGAEAHAVGRRLAAQFNENSKVPVLLAAYPELDHNELEGWGPAPEQAGDFVLLTVHAPDGNKRLDRRLEESLRILAPSFHSAHVLTARGEAPLARILDLVHYGDCLSCRVAQGRGVDPVPVDRIARLKKALGDRSSRN